MDGQVIEKSQEHFGKMTDPRVGRTRLYPLQEFHTADIARQFMEKTKTTTGLKVTVEVLGRVYVKGKKVCIDFLENIRIVFDAHLPCWNYCAVPTNGCAR